MLSAAIHIGEAYDRGADLRGNVGVFDLFWVIILMSYNICYANYVFHFLLESLAWRE